MKRRRFLPLLIVLVLVAGRAAYWRLTQRPPSPVACPPAPPPAQSGGEETEEGKTRRRLVGTWQDEYKGKRTMTLKEDGTGTMVVELSGAQAFLFAAKLRFDMTWSLTGQVLTKKTVGGEPKDKVNLVLNMMGDTANETIVELTDDRLLLLDKDGETKYDWRRVVGE